MKKLRLSNDKKLCGVCGGIAEYFEIDPTIVRLIYAVLVCASFGTAILMYILAIFILPKADEF